MKYLVIALLLLSNPVLANVCEVKSGEIKLSGNDTLYNAENNWIEDCAGTIALVSDEARICFFNQLKQWRCDNQQKRAGVIAVSQMTIASEYATGFLAALKGLFDPDTEMEYGGLRLKEGEPLPGFPYSEILLPKESVDLNIERATAETVSRFNLVDVALGQEIFTSTSPGASVAVPANVLSAGREYQWTMTGNSKEFTGIFSVVDTTDQLEFEADLASALATGGLTGISEDLMRAVVAREYGYTFDYEQAWYKARASVSFIQEGGTP